MVQVRWVNKSVGQCQRQSYAGGPAFRFHETEGPFPATQERHVGSDVRLIGWTTDGPFRGNGCALDSKAESSKREAKEVMTVGVMEVVSVKLKGCRAPLAMY